MIKKMNLGMKKIINKIKNWLLNLIGYDAKYSKIWKFDCLDSDCNCDKEQSQKCKKKSKKWYYDSKRKK